MPAKQKKGNKKNSHPSGEKNKPPLFPDATSAASPSTNTTNYREIHANEAEALRSIYDDDFQYVEIRQSAWKVLCSVLELC